MALGVSAVPVSVSFRADTSGLAEENVAAESDTAELLFTMLARGATGTPASAVGAIHRVSPVTLCL